MSDETVRAVVFRDGDGWIAHCVEYDVCAQGPDAKTAVERFKDALRSDLTESHVRGGTLVSNIGRAPDYIADMFKSAQDGEGFMSKGSIAPDGGESVGYELALCA